MIIAAILTLVTINRVNNFAKHIVATTTEAALSKINLPSRAVLANLRDLTEEIRVLRISLQKTREGQYPILQSETEKLREALSTLSASVDRLTNARTILTDEAIGRFGRSVGDTLGNMKGCAANTGQMQLDQGKSDWL